MTLQDQAAGARSGFRALIADLDWTTILSREELLQDLLRVAAILVLAFVGYRMIRVLTRRLEREVREEDPVVKRLREQRSKTLASLLNNVALVIIITVALLTILGTFINIAPLLASVGVVGLAISFGAQSLVKDVISGTFLLIEGQFGIGDVVRVGDTAGMVEKITLRTTVLRDLYGAVHIIPNGEITKLTNLTKTWSRAVLDVGVAYKEDVDRVIAVLGEVGRELYTDPDWGALLVEEPEVPGVENFGDSAVVIRMVAKTLPLKQWDIARELRRRIKKRFDRDGIEIPFPHVTFFWGASQEPAALAAAGPQLGAEHGA